MDQEVPLEDAGGWQCPPSCPGPWQLTADVWGCGPTGPCSLPAVAQPEAIALESAGIASGPCPLGPPSMMDKGGEEVQRFSCGEA